MPLSDRHQEPPDILQPLQRALTTGDSSAILAAMPEPPAFLASLFSLTTHARDQIIASILPIFPTDEDRWELIEAAAQDSVVRPERGAFISVIPHIPTNMLEDAQKLATQHPNPTVRKNILAALATRMAE